MSSEAPSPPTPSSPEREPAIHVASPDWPAILAEELGLAKRSVAAIIGLLEDGCTAPFIARYRKEATGGAEDVAVVRTQERLKVHRELFERRKVILETIHGQGKLTPELESAILAAKTRTQLEDLYLPYRPKRRTRATMAKERGLEPLAERMWKQEDRAGDPEEIARRFVDAERGVESVEDALAGARDIVAERVAETAEWRAAIRDLTWKQGNVDAQASKGKSDPNSKFADYFDFSEPVRRIPSHRVLAIQRGEKEGAITQRVSPDPELAHSLLCRRVLQRPESIWTEQVRQATVDAYDRLLSTQVATDVRSELKSRADTEAIEVFASNLTDLLMAPPFGQRPVMAIDPGFRTGCKVAILSATGQLLDHGVVYPTQPRADVRGTEAALDRWFAQFPDLAAVAVGNGTGGRETFSVVRRYLTARERSAVAVLVNESGASVYSASEVARTELPGHDVTVRGAASIGRRLQDPLAELVKIDPKSIGVGQYQHDVDQKLLKAKLDDVVIRCVNGVGVDVNTASPSLLQYVSGLSAKVARAVVEYRDKQGGLRNRAELRKVSGFGAKKFEQAAGFLRVKGGDPLDDSAVHPERYALVARIAADLGHDVGDLVGAKELVRSIDIQQYVGDDVGLFTLEDILDELEKPGRDPRDDFSVVDFRDDVQELEDLANGMVLNGVVTNVTQFGAFVDIGVHQDGLVHVSQIANHFVRDPADELHVGQKVRVRVMDVDLERRRIGLSIKQV